MDRRLLALAGLGIGLLALSPAPADAAANCSRTSTGLLALPDLGAGTYRGEPGGLYPGGSNQPPAAYRQAGLQAAARVSPPAVLLSIGMSNATQEFSAFARAERADPQKADSVLLVDGAQGGQTAAIWAAPGARTWTVVEQRLQQAGAADGQVQAIWLKEADAGPTGDELAYSRRLEGELAAIVAIAARRFPNLRQVFVSPRTYAGYATTALNPEPYAYASGFAVKWLVADSVAHPDRRPWVGWGPYLWTDGTRGTGFQWTCSDAAADGTHPSPQGMEKVSRLLRDFFTGSPFTAWFGGRAAPQGAAAPPPAAPRLPGWAPAAGVAGAGILLVLGLSSLRRRRARGRASTPSPPAPGPG